MVNCELCGRGGNLISVLVEKVEMKVCSGCSGYGKKQEQIRGSYGGKSSFVKNKKEFKVVDSVNKLLREQREGRNMSQSQFADLLQERESVVAKWENGILKPSVNRARDVGRVLGLKLTEEIKEDGTVVLSSKKPTDSFTLGDFIKKPRKRL